MEYRRIGRGGLLVSSIGLGGATFGREIDEPAAHAVLDRALERGITLFDTAEAYSAGRSEEILGRWIASRGVRDKIVLSTKAAPPLGAERLIASAEASLRRLQTEAIDLFLLHSWDSRTPLEAGPTTPGTTPHSSPKDTPTAATSAAATHERTTAFALREDASAPPPVAAS